MTNAKGQPAVSIPQNIRGRPPTEGANINAHSSPDDVRAWLRAKGFKQRSVAPYLVTADTFDILLVIIFLFTVIFLLKILLKSVNIV